MGERCLVGLLIPEGRISFADVLQQLLYKKPLYPGSLAIQRAVIVENRYSLVLRNIIGIPGGGDFFDESCNGLLRAAIGT